VKWSLLIIYILVLNDETGDPQLTLEKKENILIGAVALLVLRAFHI
jgi:hypothetical protein